MRGWQAEGECVKDSKLSSASQYYCIIRKNLTSELLDFLMMNRLLRVTVVIR